MKKHRQFLQHKKAHTEKKGRTLTGRFSAAQGGFGFLSPDTLDLPFHEVFIPPKYTGQALDGDQVEVRLLEERDREPGRSPAGKIVRVIERKRETIVAKMDSSHSARPLDQHLPDSIPVNSIPRGIKAGEWVKLRLLNDGSKHTEKLRGSVEAALGRAGTVAGDLEAIAAEYHIEPGYGPELEAAAAKLTPSPIDRRDLTDAFTITIDPPDAHDFDDAISIVQGNKRTEFLLGVHIADVAAWIHPGTRFDKEAGKRAFSSYMPGRFSPMLPKPLTSRISLKQNIDSPAHTVLFTIRRTDGKILSCERFHSTVRVDARLDYPTVQRFIEHPRSKPEGWTPDFCKTMRILIDVVRKMRKMRKEIEQFLSLETPEVRVICNESTQEITGLERKVQGEADQLVEECMLAANSAVAGELIIKHIPALYRIHAEPFEDRVTEFSAFVQSVFHISTGDLLSSRTACNHFLESLPDDHRKPVILSHFLRALPRAGYEADPGLHYGLGKLQYAHFTSPIRRYPDLTVHQQLWAFDLNTRLRSKRILQGVAEDCTRKEENVDNAYFAANDRLKLHFLREHGALENTKMYEAVINKTTSGGLLCDIPELGIFGFVPSDYLRGGSFRRSGPARSRFRAAQTHTEYKAGDFIYLMLDSVDPAAGRAVFRPAL